MKKTHLKKVFSLLILTLAWTSANTLFAEPAPVYDADSMPSQFDSPDQPQADDLPPPPPEQDNAFVPMPQHRENEQHASMQPSQPPVLTQQHGDQNAASVEERLERMEQQLYTLQDNTQSSDSSPRIDFLLSQVQALRTQVEQLTRQVQALELRPQAQVAPVPAADPDKSLVSHQAIPDEKNKLAADTPKPAPVTTPPAPQAKPMAQPNVAEEQQIYQTAYNLIKMKKYNDAVNTLQSMLKRYPSGQFASNAHYWLGELYGVMGKNDQALSEFLTVVRSYPDSPRVSDAQLKVGLIYATQLKWNEAKSAFKTVINRYPGTTSSRLAAEQIKQIKQAGH